RAGAGHRGGDPQPSPDDPGGERRRGRVGAAVAGADPAVDRAVLHVHGAGHRGAALLLGAARPGVRAVPHRLPAGVGVGPDGPGAGHVRHPRQGLRGRRGRNPRGAGVRAADAAGPRPTAGGPAVLRPVRPGRDLADRPEAGAGGAGAATGPTGLTAPAPRRPRLVSWALLARPVAGHRVFAAVRAGQPRWSPVVAPVAAGSA